PDRTVAIVNTDLMPTIDTIRNRTIAGPGQALDQVNAATLRGRNIFVDANRMAEGLFGTHLAVNIFMMGIAYQGGLIPISLKAIEQAVELNGVEVERNLQIFSWGRKYYEDARWVEAQIAPAAVKQEEKLDRAAELREYQNDAWAKEYSDFVEK